jgi:periplasmic protein TonB
MEISLPYREAPNLKAPLGYSVAFHVILVGAFISSTVLSHQPVELGVKGEAGPVTINLVRNVPAIPLPKPDIATNSRVVDNTKGLYQTETPPKAIPAPQPKIPPPDESKAIYLPKFDKYKQPEYLGKPSKVLPNNTPPPKNAIPYGNGGAPQVPTSSFKKDQTKSSQISISESSGGSSGTLFPFPWYIEAVQRRVSLYWQNAAATVDPSVSFAPAATITFTILRDGTITNVQIVQSSGNQSVDTAAIRAVESSSPLDHLPDAYSGSSVNVVYSSGEFHR